MRYILVIAISLYIVRVEADLSLKPRDNTQLTPANLVYTGGDINCPEVMETSSLSSYLNVINFHTSLALNWLDITTLRNPDNLIEINFEQPDLISNGLYASGNPPELTNNIETVFEGKQSLLICLDKERSPVQYRTEFILYPTHFDKKFIDFELDKEYWIGFALLLDKNYKIPRLGDILFQIHGRPDILLGEDYRNPNLTLSISGDLDNGKLAVDKTYWSISIKGDDRKITPIEGDRYPTLVDTAISPAEDDIGFWVTWVIHFKNTYNPNGYMEIWKNGEKVFYQENIRTAFNDAKGSYLKMGSYKWSWRGKNDYPVINPATRLSYLDSLRIAQGVNRYNDVAPKHYSNSLAEK